MHTRKRNYASKSASESFFQHGAIISTTVAITVTDTVKKLVWQRVLMGRDQKMAHENTRWIKACVASFPDVRNQPTCLLHHCALSPVPVLRRPFSRLVAADARLQVLACMTRKGADTIGAVQ